MSTTTNEELIERMAKHGFTGIAKNKAGLVGRRPDGTWVQTSQQVVDDIFRPVNGDGRQRDD